MISANDNLVSGTAVAELRLGARGVLPIGGCLTTTLGPRRLTTFRLFLSASITGGGAAPDAYDCSDDGSPGTAFPTSVGGGSIVGWLVSMTMRSGAAEWKLSE
jgi:hypothetical protein